MIQGLAALEKAGSIGPSIAAGSTSTGFGAGLETSFSEALTAAAQRTVGTLQGAEALSLQALQGDVNTREVVDAVMSAEQTLQAAIAIRDKIVTAYLEVSRMQI